MVDGSEGEILEARAVEAVLFGEADDVPSREELLARDRDMKLFVGGAGPKYLVIKNEENWTKERTNPPYNT